MVVGSTPTTPAIFNQVSMTYYFSEAQLWPHDCALRTQGQLAQLSKTLPSKLRPLARALHRSPVSWEYKFFWVQSAEQLVRQRSLVKKLKGSWGPLHDQLFEDWNRSEHAEVFLKSLNKSSNMKAASLNAEKNVETQLLSIAHSIFKVKPKSKLKDQRVFELGQFPQGKVTERIIIDRNVEIEFESWDKKNFKKHLANIIKSLSLIKTHSPECFEFFKCFTKKIIPIKQKELVSYSLQSLPGHSFINLYNRDRLDLLDDLIHENGHHHLNHFLILENPLIEDPDLIFYSPWRETRRPLRGIYHAYLTFFFAQKLYFDLMSEVKNKDFVCSKSEEQKIYYRFCEETLSLNYSAKDIERAFKAGKISEAGFNLFQHFRKLDKKMARDFNKVFLKLNMTKRKSIKKLSQLLQSQNRLKIS